MPLEDTFRDIWERVSQRTTLLKRCPLCCPPRRTCQSSTTRTANQEMSSPAVLFHLRCRRCRFQSNNTTTTRLLTGQYHPCPTLPREVHQRGITEESQRHTFFLSETLVFVDNGCLLAAFLSDHPCADTVTDARNIGSPVRFYCPCLQQRRHFRRG
jgi:hypothetical protein